MVPANARGSTAARFRVVVRGTEIELVPGVVVMGRESTSAVVLDDPRASRRHAQLTVEEAGVTLADLNSVNGTCVNGERLTAPRALVDGDLITVGDLEITFVDVRHSAGRAAPPSPRPPSSKAGAADAEDAGPSTQTRRVALGHAPGIPTPPATAIEARPPVPRPRPPAPKPARPDPRVELFPDDPTLVTGQFGAFQLYGKLADQAFATQDDARAAQILTSQFRAIQADLKRRGGVPVEATDFVSRYALRLSLATRDGSWLDALFRVFAGTRRPLPTTLVDEIAAARGRLPALDRGAMREYVEAMRGVETLTAADRFAVQRIASFDPTAR